MSTTHVPFKGNDLRIATVYLARMAAPEHDWYLKEWLGALDTNPSWLETETGWTHRICSQLVNRKTRWNRDHLMLAARLLRISPFELLMHPDDAFHLRRLRADELQLRAAEKRQDFQPAKHPTERLTPKRKAG